MSREKTEEKTTVEKLAKMERIHAGHSKRRQVLKRHIKRARTRLRGAVKEAAKATETGAELKEIAQKETLKRRFTFDVEQLLEQLADVTGKETWAARMVQNLRAQHNTNDAGDLIHRPFTGLKLKLSTPG
jgi:hypothetical protein